MSLSVTEVDIPADLASTPAVAFAPATGVSVVLLAHAAKHYADQPGLFPGSGWGAVLPLNDGTARQRLTDDTSSSTLTAQLLSAIRMIPESSECPSFPLTDSDTLLAAFGLPLPAQQPHKIGDWDIPSRSRAMGLLNAAGMIALSPTGCIPSSAGIPADCPLLDPGASLAFTFAIGDPEIVDSTSVLVSPGSPDDYAALLAEFEAHKAASASSMQDLRAANSQALAALTDQIQSQVDAAFLSASSRVQPAGPSAGGGSAPLLQVVTPSQSGQASACGNGAPISAVVSPAASAAPPLRPSQVDSNNALSGIISALRPFASVTLRYLHGIMKRNDAQSYALGGFELVSKGTAAADILSTAELNLLVHHIQSAYRELVSSDFVNRIFGEQLWPALMQVQSSYSLAVQIDYVQSNVDALQLAFRRGNRGVDLSIDWALLQAAQLRADSKSKRQHDKDKGERDPKRQKPDRSKALIPAVIRANAAVVRVTPEMRLSWCQNQACGFECASKGPDGACPYKHLA